MTSKLVFGFLAAAFALTSLLAESASAQASAPQPGNQLQNNQWQSKIGPSLRMTRSFREQRADILVILRDGADLNASRMLMRKADKGRFVAQSLKQVAARSQNGLAQFLDSEKALYRRFYIMNAVAVRGASVDLIKKIAARNDVRKIIADPTIRGSIPQARGAVRFSQGTGVGANITSTGAEAVWNEFKARGQGIVVAGQDTGVHWDHPSLVRSYRGSVGNFSVNHNFSWHDSIRAPIGNGRNSCGYDTTAPCDDNRHGTHTVGTIVGDDGGANKIGMAPEAKWIACRNMDAGLGRPSTYIECFEWFLAPYAKGQSPLTGDPSLAPHVINNSWGCPEEEGCEGKEMLPVLEALYKAGIMTVASAGNEGPACGTIGAQPATHSAYTLSVGAHNHRDGKIASFSSRGPSVIDGQVGPDLTAPGVSIRSAVPGGGYEEMMWSGTSMAGPHVAGAVALLWSAQPKLIGNIDATVRLLTQTAKPAFAPNQTCGGIPGTNHPNNTFGFGHLDVLAAVKAAATLVR